MAILKKIKGSSSSIKMKYLLFVFVAVLLAVLPLRVYQLLVIVDTETGFFTASDITVPILAGAVSIFAALFLVLSYLSKEVPSPKLPVGKNPVLGISASIMSVALVYDIISVERAIFPTRQNTVEIYLSILKSNLAGATGFAHILQMLFALLAVIYFAVFAISHLNGRASYREFKLLALTPLCWSMTRLISHMLNAISFLSVSELILEIFTLVFFMLFFITFARISSGVFTVDSMWGIYGYGFCAIMLAALVTVPRIVILAVGLESVKGYALNFADVAALIFILSYIFASLGVGFKDGIKNRKIANEIELPEEEEALTEDELEDIKREAREEAQIRAMEEAEKDESAFEEQLFVDDEEAENDEAEAEYNEAFDTADELGEIEIIEETELVDDSIPVEDEVAEDEIESDDIILEADEADEEEAEDISVDGVENLDIAEDFDDVGEQAMLGDVLTESEQQEISKKKRFFGRKKRKKDEDVDFDDTLAPVSLAELKKNNKDD